MSAFTWVPKSSKIRPFGLKPMVLTLPHFRKRPEASSNIDYDGRVTW